MKLQKLALEIRRGASVDLPIRIETSEWRYAAIQSIAQSAPVSIVATGHGIPDGWRAAVANARGMTELNAENNPPKDKELRRVTVVDADTVEFNAVNAAGFKTHTADTGQLAFYAPVDWAGYIGARMDVKAKVGGEVLASFSTTDGTLEIDAVNDTLWLRLTPAQASLLLAKAYVFDIELLRAGGGVVAACAADSTFLVLPETTTTE